MLHFPISRASWAFGMKFNPKKAKVKASCFIINDLSGVQVSGDIQKGSNKSEIIRGEKDENDKYG